MSYLIRYKKLIDEVLAAPLVDTVVDPRSIGSGWGGEQRPFHEVLGSTFTIDPHDKVLFTSRARPLNIEYALVSSLWILLGRNDLASVSRFNPRGSAFSLDGFTLSAAFGHRLMNEDGDQIAAALRLINDDASTRRAVCFIGRPYDLTDEIRDFPCASLMQFFRRSDFLHAAVYMRSQSLFGVFPYDVINFRYLQWQAAERLRLAPGSLHMSFGSLHVYAVERHRAEAFLADTDITSFALPELPWDNLGGLMQEWTESSNADQRIRQFIDCYQENSSPGSSHCAGDRTCRHARCDQA